MTIYKFEVRATTVHLNNNKLDNSDLWALTVWSRSSEKILLLISADGDGDGERPDFPFVALTHQFASHFLT